MNDEVLLLRLIANRLRHTVWPAHFLLLTIAAAALSTVLAPGQTFGQTVRPEPPRLTVAQKKIVQKFERELNTKLNSKGNPGDKDTWYVILFTDTAAGARQSSSVSGEILTITRELQAARHSAVKMTQGRKEAALLLLQCLYAGNSAHRNCGRQQVGGRSGRAQVARSAGDIGFSRTRSRPRRSSTGSILSKKTRCVSGSHSLFLVLPLRSRNRRTWLVRAEYFEQEETEATEFSIHAFSVLSVAFCSRSSQ
jgi:hypothetical protein